jgi:hypothetical protein
VGLGTQALTEEPHLVCWKLAVELLVICLCMSKCNLDEKPSKHHPRILAPSLKNLQIALHPSTPYQTYQPPPGSAPVTKMDPKCGYCVHMAFGYGTRTAVRSC